MRLAYTICYTVVMQISVLIPGKNEAGTVDKLLKSLTKQTRQANQVVFINSHSTDDTLAHVEAFSDRLPLTIVTAKKRGVANARNEGSQKATGDMLLFVDADIILPPQFLADFEQQVTARNLEIGGCTQRMPSKKLSIRIGARVMNGYLRLMQHTPWPISFSCTFATKKAFESLSGFDSTLYIMEDYDLALRGHRAGYNVGIVTSPFIASDRRFIENPSQGWRGVYGELYRYTHGLRVTKPIYEYEMGGKSKTDKNALD